MKAVLDQLQDSFFLKKIADQQRTEILAGQNKIGHWKEGDITAVYSWGYY